MKNLRWLGLGVALTLSSTQALAISLEQAIQGEHRSEQNKARDVYRHPKETLEFFGIRPDMTVVEVWPGAGGWYTEILAPYLREKGTFYAAQFDPDTGSNYYVKARQDFENKLAASPDLYDQVKVTSFQPPQLTELAPAGTVDMVLTFRNVHNWYMRGGGEEKLMAAFQGFHRALKPGGVLGVVEHRLPAARSADDQEQSGYMLQDYVIEIAKKAGFKLVDQSEVNANPKDIANHPKGVWTLPPRLALGEQDREKYLAIGESDRMTLKFIKE